MKTIPGNPKYSINEDGTKIYNLKTKRELKLQKKEYIYVTLLYETGEYACKRKLVHRLVAETYLPPSDPDKIWVNHKDGNKHNNHYSNLEWTTISENIQHAYDTGLKKIYTGKDHWRYGVAVGKVTKNRMSRAKQGDKHPKFTGWYVVKGKRYGSAYEAERATGIARHTIFRRCKDGKKKGFSFEPKTDTPPPQTRNI